MPSHIQIHPSDSAPSREPWVQSVFRRGDEARKVPASVTQQRDKSTWDQAAHWGGRGRGQDGGGGGGLWSCVLPLGILGGTSGLLLCLLPSDLLPTLQTRPSSKKATETQPHLERTTRHLNCFSCDGFWSGSCNRQRCPTISPLAALAELSLGYLGRVPYVPSETRGEGVNIYPTFYGFACVF